MVDVTSLLQFDMNDVNKARAGQERITNTKSTFDKLNKSANSFGQALFKEDECLFVTMDGNLGYRYYEDYGESQYVLIMEVFEDKSKVNTFPESLRSQWPTLSLTTIPLSESFSKPIQSFRSIVAGNSGAVKNMMLDVDHGYNNLNAIEMENNYLVSLSEFDTGLEVGRSGARLNLSLKTSYLNQVASFTTGDFSLSDKGLCPAFVADFAKQVTAALIYIDDPQFLIEILGFDCIAFDSNKVSSDNRIDDDYMAEVLGRIYDQMLADESWAAMKGVLLHAAAKGALDAPRKQILTRLCQDQIHLKGLMDALDHEWTTSVIPDGLKSEITAALILDGYNGIGRSRKMKI